jgi:GAF domain-containing protein
MTDPRSTHDRRTAALLVELEKELESDRGDAESIRASVAHGAKALGATAASIFLLSPDGKALHGALVGWDWTRTSFEVPLAEWPNVRRCVDTNAPVHFTAAEAEGPEEGWFEQRGIGATTCAPMTFEGRVLGVLFFDYAPRAEPEIDLDVAKRVADQCALLVRRAEDALTSGAAPSSGPSARDR